MLGLHVRTDCMTCTASEYPWIAQHIRGKVSKQSPVYYTRVQLSMLINLTSEICGVSNSY